MNATALIAEDEPLLAKALQAELKRAWPDLQVLATVGDGLSAVQQALALVPDVLFFDIRMPGLDGLEAAAELVDSWRSGQANSAPFPMLVFVTAYDQYAVQAFEVHAVDYVLKPVQAARLQKTVAKVQHALAQRSRPAAGSVLPQGGQGAQGKGGESDGNSEDADLALTVNQLRHLLAATQGTMASSSAAVTSPLKMIQASVGSQIRMVPIDEVLYFEAADKYIRVLTGPSEYLIRTPLKDLLPQLDPQQFWQIHRGTVVRASAIEAVTRDEAGKLHLSLRGRAEKLPVSRLYAHLFKAM